MNWLKRFYHDENALAYIWGMCLICVVLSAVVYFPLSYVWDHLYASITGTYVFTGDTAYGLTAIKLLLSFLLVFVLVALIKLAIVNAKSQQYSGY